MTSNATKMTDYWLIIHGGLIKSGHCICIQKSSEFMKNEQLVLKQATLFFNEYKAIYGKDIQGEFVTGKSSSKSKYELNKDFFEKIASFQYYDSETLYKISISKIQEQMREVFESSCRRIKQDKEEDKEEEDEEEEEEEKETKKTKNIKETKKTKNIQEESKSDKKSEIKESKSDKKSDKESKSDKKSEVKEPKSDKKSEIKESKSDKKSEVKESKSDKKKNDEKVNVVKSKKIEISSDSECNSEQEEN